MAIKSVKANAEVVKVKQSNELSRARIEPAPKTIWDEKIIALISSSAKISKADETEAIFREHIIPFSELADGKPLSTDQHRRAKGAVNYVSHCVFTATVGRRGWLGVPIFHHLKIDDDGNISAQLNDALKPYLFSLKENFTLLSLPEFMDLGTIYAQQMYRLLMSYRSMGVIRADLDDIHEFLQSPESFRNDFRNFRLRILEPVTAEINTKTSLKYKYRLISKGRGGKVVAVEFTFIADKGVKELPAPKAAKAPAGVPSLDDDIVAAEEMAEDLKRLGLGGIFDNVLGGMVEPRAEQTAPIGGGAEFSAFWAAYPRKDGKDKALEVWETVSAEDKTAAVEAAAAYASEVESKKRKSYQVKYPENFLKQFKC